MPDREERAHAARAGPPAVRRGRPALALGSDRGDLHLEGPPRRPRGSAAPPAPDAEEAAEDSGTPPGSHRVRKSALEGILQGGGYERQKTLDALSPLRVRLVKFSIITVNYESWPYTLRCIDSLYRTGY